jgi:hypothetical protein
MGAVTLHAQKPEAILNPVGRANSAQASNGTEPRLSALTAYRLRTDNAVTGGETYRHHSPIMFAAWEYDAGDVLGPVVTWNEDLLTYQEGGSQDGWTWIWSQQSGTRPFGAAGNQGMVAQSPGQTLNPVSQVSGATERLAGLRAYRFSVASMSAEDTYTHPHAISFAMIEPGVGQANGPVAVWAQNPAGNVVTFKEPNSVDCFLWVYSKN